MRCFLLILLSVVLFCSIVFAEDKPKQLEEIVVTATRTEKEMETAPGSVSVVTKDDIGKRNIKSVDEALNTTPGVFNNRTKGFLDSIAYVALRGIPGSYRTLFMMDGITLNDAFSGGIKPGGFALEDIERIEVVRGPFSSLYGGYAMGGVKNNGMA